MDTTTGQQPISNHPISDGREVRVTHNGHESLIYMVQPSGNTTMICSMYGAAEHGTREAARIVRGIEFDMAH